MKGFFIQLSRLPKPKRPDTPEQLKPCVLHHFPLTAIAMLGAVLVTPANAQLAESANSALNLQLESLADCANELDRAVLLDSNGESQSAQELMESLEAPCSQFAQIAHNLGVFAGRSGNWDEAQSHFERSIQGNSRAAMSLDHLRQIHRFRASQAWREALGTSLDPSANAPVPDLALQDSTVTNNDAKLARHDASELHQLSTIEYELFDWWQSARIGNRIGWMAHYTRGFAPQDPATIAAFDWDELRHTIALVQNEAVVVMMYPVHASHNRADNAQANSSDNGLKPDKPSTSGALMLFRLEGNRWKIYQETPL